MSDVKPAQPRRGNRNLFLVIGAVVVLGVGGVVYQQVTEEQKLAQLGRVIGALGYACPATALVLTMQYMQHRSMGRKAPARSWPEPLARRLVHEASQGVSLINALRVEPELGSPARGGLPATVARHTTEGWRLSGHKIYSTGSPILRWYSVWARTDEPEPRVGVFLVPRERGADDARIRVIESWDHLGLRASGSHEAVFDDVPLPADHAVDVRAPDAWAVSAASHADADAQTDQQAWMVALLGSLYDAVARAARDWLLDFATTRAPSGLGAPLATLPRVQEAVGEIEGWLHANRVLLASDAGATLEIFVLEDDIVRVRVLPDATAHTPRTWTIAPGRAPSGRSFSTMAA